MPEPPLISTNEAIRVFGVFGWYEARRESSHVSLKKPGAQYLLTIPNRREVPRGTLRQLIGKAGLSVDEFNATWRSLSPSLPGATFPPLPRSD